MGHTHTALRRMGLNIEKCVKTGQFLLGTSIVTRKGVSIYGLVYIRLYYTPIRQKKKKNGNARQLLVEVSDHKFQQNMYNGVRNTQKSPLKTPCEPVFITRKYACHTEINEYVQNVSHDS